MRHTTPLKHICTRVGTCSKALVYRASLRNARSSKAPLPLILLSAAVSGTAAAVAGTAYTGSSTSASIHCCTAALQLLLLLFLDEYISRYNFSSSSLLIRIS
jgi:hypothetical protein